MGKSGGQTDEPHFPRQWNTKGRETPRTPNLKTTAKPETSKLKDLTLKGTEGGERNCETTRTKSAKVKQMYEVEQGTYAK